MLRPALRPQLLTVDSVLYGRHFDSRLSPRAAGAKLLKRNLSDLAAMGGRPTAAVVALCLDGRVRRQWLEGFYRGLAACARRHHVAIVGGDIAQADGGLAASLTLLGTVAGPRALTRTGGRPGDHLYVTGVLGGSVRSGHHHAFQPRLAEGAWCARRPEVRAMIDLSDGLAKDAPALCPPGTAPALFAAALPRREGASLAAALTEGEDYELVFAVAARADRPAFERAWRRAFPRVRLSWIGRLARRGELPPDALVPRRFPRLRAPAARAMKIARAPAGGNPHRHGGRRPAKWPPGWRRSLPADATLALHGDLGAGKTTFVQGLARAWRVSGPVTSPTYTIFTLHRGDRLCVHLDGYRLEAPGAGRRPPAGGFSCQPLLPGGRVAGKARLPPPRRRLASGL